MCLILLAWRVHPVFPLVVAANRDEFFARPTAPAAAWRDQPQVFAGRDLQSGGTWLGVGQGQTLRFAGLTNFRDPQQIRSGTPSRGQLVSDFLAGSQTPAQYAQHLERVGADYNGFNLLFAAGADLYYYANNRPGGAVALAPGIYGLSNHLLDTPWPKVALGKSRLAQALAHLPACDALCELLLDDTLAADDELPRTGVSLAWERLLSAAFVRSPDYGTRSVTTILGRQDQCVDFQELSFGPEKQLLGRVQRQLAANGGQKNPAQGE